MIFNTILYLYVLVCSYAFLYHRCIANVVSASYLMMRL